jgi:hypothetical protein
VFDVFSCRESLSHFVRTNIIVFLSVVYIPLCVFFLFYAGLDDQGSGVRFPAGAGSFCLRHHVQDGSGAHLASYPMGTGCPFPGSKTAGA